MINTFDMLVTSQLKNLILVVRPPIVWFLPVLLIETVPIVFCFYLVVNPVVVHSRYLPLSDMENMHVLYHNKSVSTHIISNSQDREFSFNGETILPVFFHGLYCINQCSGFLGHQQPLDDFFVFAK